MGLDRRITTTIATVALLASASLSSPSLGADDASRRAAVADLDMACNEVCARDLKTCSSSPNRVAPICDTNFVGCTKGCGSCKGAFSACMVGKDADAATCSPPFVACMRSTVADRTKSGTVSFPGGDGTTVAKAVKVVGTTDDVEADIAEGLWVRQRHPEWRKVAKKAPPKGPVKVEEVEYETEKGGRRVYFDVTDVTSKEKGASDARH